MNRFVWLAGGYLGAAAAFSLFYLFNTKPSPAAIACAAIPRELKLVLGPLALTECCFDMYRKLPGFLGFSAVLLFLFAMIAWAPRPWMRAAAWALAFVLWLGLGLIQQVSFPMSI